MIVSALKFKMFLKVLWERSYKGYLKLKCFKTQMHLSTVCIETLTEVFVII